MKKLSILAAFFILFLMGAAFSQTGKAALANFDGTWELDAAKSRLPDDVIIESGSLIVEQTKKKLTVTLEFNRERRFRTPAADNEDGATGRSVPVGDGTVVFHLNGNEIVPQTTAGDKVLPVSTVTLQAEIDTDGNLKLTKIGKYDSQANALDFKTVEIWELLDDGKTLKISQETETQQGARTAEMYFMKKDSASGELKMNNNSPPKLL